MLSTVPASLTMLLRLGKSLCAENFWTGMLGEDCRCCCWEYIYLIYLIWAD